MSTQAAEIWMNKRKAEMIAKYDAMGLRASGQWAESLEPTVERTQTGYRLVMKGAKHHGIMVTGRKPNTNQDPEALRKFVGWAGSTYLAEWVKRKGINISPYAIAYSIAREGIKVPNPNNDGTLMDGIVTDEKIKELLKEIGLGLVRDYTLTKI